MPANTPLLQQQSPASNQHKSRNKKRDDHPIFLRACHSPWKFITQKRLATLRFLVAAYMLATLVVIIRFGIVEEGLGWMNIFDFGNVIYLIQFIYQFIVFTWTYMHLEYPHLEHDHTYSMRVKKFLSPPRSNSLIKNHHHYFSIYYATATCFPHVSTFIYWAVLTPKHETQFPADQTMGHGDLRAFYIINKYGINSLIALIEIMLFSSMKRYDPLWSHLSGILTALVMYIGWAFIGHAFTDKFYFYFLDYQKVGWDNVVIGSLAFIAVGEFFFFVVYALKGLREELVAKAERKGYDATLPH